MGKKIYLDSPTLGHFLVRKHRTQNNHLWYTIKATWVPEKIYFDDEKIYFDDEKIYFDDEK